MEALLSVMHFTFRASRKQVRLATADTLTETIWENRITAVTKRMTGVADTIEGEKLLPKFGGEEVTCSLLTLHVGNGLLCL